MLVSQKSRRQKYKTRMKSVLRGTSSRPRLSVYRSGKYLYVQVIDDEKSRTLLSSSTRTLSGGTKSERSFKAGKNLAEKLIGINVRTVVFDRGGYRYHGRVRLFAEGARSGGLSF